MGFRYHICRLPCGELALVEGEAEAAGGGVAVASRRALMRGRLPAPACGLPCCRGAAVVEHVIAGDEEGAAAEYRRRLGGERE